MDDSDNRWAWLSNPLFRFGASIWTGCTMVGLALLAGDFTARGVLAPEAGLVLLLSPLLLANEMACFTFFFAVTAFAVMAVRREVGPVAWTVTALGVALPVFLGHVQWIGTWPGVWVASGSLLLMALMLPWAVWWVRQWRLQRLGAEWTMLHARNARRRADREAREEREKKKGASP